MHRTCDDQPISWLIGSGSDLTFFLLHATHAFGARNGGGLNSLIVVN